LEQPDDDGPIAPAVLEHQDRIAPDVGAPESDSRPRRPRTALQARHLDEELVALAPARQAADDHPIVPRGGDGPRPFEQAGQQVLLGRRGDGGKRGRRIEWVRHGEISAQF
jgi:hypothetical protein